MQMTAFHECHRTVSMTDACRSSLSMSPGSTILGISARDHLRAVRHADALGPVVNGVWGISQTGDDPAEVGGSPSLPIRNSSRSPTGSRGTALIQRCSTSVPATVSDRVAGRVIVRWCCSRRCGPASDPVQRRHLGSNGRARRLTTLAATPTSRTPGRSESSPASTPGSCSRIYTPNSPCFLMSRGC